MSSNSRRFRNKEEWLAAGEEIAKYHKRLIYVQSRYDEIDGRYDSEEARAVIAELEELHVMGEDIDSLLYGEASNVR